MKYSVFFVVAFLSVVSVMHAQEVGVATTTTPPSLSSILIRAGESAESILERIRVNLLDESRREAEQGAQTHVSSTYAPIIDQVFGMALTVSDTAIVPGTGTCVPFTHSFDLGDEHEEVKRVQEFLNTHHDSTRVATAGPGSRGQETTHYGARTKASVIAFQRMYAEAILAPIGLSQPTGFWGASTRAQAHHLLGCVPAL